MRDKTMGDELFNTPNYNNQKNSTVRFLYIGLGYFFKDLDAFQIL